MDKILILRKKENKGVLATSNSRGVLSGACVNLRARGERPTLLTERAVL
jgi:hypothetical protein